MENEDNFNDEEIEEVEASIATIEERKIDLTEEDFADFIGENADTYFRKFRNFSINEPNKFMVTWNWAAFLFSFIWFAYRKMYMWASGVFLIEVAIIEYFPSLLVIIYRIVLGMTGNYLYFRHTRDDIIELKVTENFSSQQELSMALQLKGGVNRWVLIVATILWLILTTH